MKGRKEKGKRQTLFFFPEFFALGHMDLLEKCAAVIRGYGARMIIYVQNKGQMDSLYGKNSDTFCANSGQTVIFAVNDTAGLKFVEERLGPRVKLRKRVTKTQYGDQVEFEPSGSFSLRSSEEIGRTSGRSGGLMIALNEGGDPLLLRRTPYTKMFKPGQYDPDPYESGRETLREKAMRMLRGAVMKLKDGWQ
jgi:type IV secretion system protein VirD4